MVISFKVNRGRMIEANLITKEGQSVRERERQTDRQTDRQTETDRDRQRQTERERRRKRRRRIVKLVYGLHAEMTT